MADDKIQVVLLFFMALGWTHAADGYQGLSAFTNLSFRSQRENHITGKELRAAVIEALMERGDLKEIDDLFVMDRQWSEETRDI